MATDSFGERVRRYRRLRKWTQSELGEKADLTKAYVGKIEAGVIQEPGIDIQRRLAKALGVELRQIADPAWYETEAESEATDWVVRMRGDPSLTDDDKAFIAQMAERLREPR